MIDLLDLSMEDSPADQSSTKTPQSSSKSNFLSPSPHRATDSSKYNTSNIKRFLKEQPEKYILVDNRKANALKPSPCWAQFALPAVKDENNHPTIIEKFASCRSCYTTYAYTYGSTKSLNAHKCPKESSSSSPSRSPFRMKSPSVIPKNTRNYAQKKKVLTCMISKWICHSMRPISIVEDQGFVDIVQQCVVWNDPHYDGKTSDVLPSRTTVQREISRQASEIRQNLRAQLVRTAEEGALAISPDLWTDRFRQTSYLGMTAHFADDDCVLHSIDLCCEPYTEVNKRADSVRKAISTALSRFGLSEYMDKVIFVCDRGSNLIKALEDQKVVHCFPHRMNNVLKRTFYSAGTKEKILGRRKKPMAKKQVGVTGSVGQSEEAHPNDESLLDDDDRDSSSSETDDEVILDTKSVELALRGLSSSSPEDDCMNVPEEKLPSQATQLLITITRCKQLCSYVKRVNWNPLLLEIGKPTIKQEIIVRWLSMSQLLESILASHSAITGIAGDRGTLHTLPSIDVSTVALIVGFFKPWKQVMERVQTTNNPSLHLVLISYWYILESLAVTKEEATDKAAKGIVFFKTRARQLFKTMFALDDMHWIAAVLNPRTRNLKLATDFERAYAHGLILSELGKIIEMEKVENHKPNETPISTNSSPQPRKKFKSFTTQFDDDLDCNEPSRNSTAAMRARREMEIYMQLKLCNNPASDDENDNPLLFWKEQKQVLPNMVKLARRVFSIPASSAAVERTFSSAGNVITQRRTNLNPSTVNDIILVRSVANHWKNQ